MIYFIGTADGTAIKIGYATDPWDRLKALQTGCHVDLKLLAIGSGDPEDEKELHRRFKAHRIRGEWFRPNPELDAFMKLATPEMRSDECYSMLRTIDGEARSAAYRAELDRGTAEYLKLHPHPKQPKGGGLTS